MFDLADIQGHRAFWVLAVNTLLHEVGIPVPVMPTALFLGAQAMHSAGEFLLLLVAIVVAMTIGNAVWFAAGRYYGAGVLKFLCRFSLTADTCVSRTEKAFGRWGWSSLVIGHFLPGVSVVAPPLAGVMGMTWRKFLALTAAGGVVYGVVLLGGGFLLRNQIESAMQNLHALGWQAVAAVLVVFAIYIAWRWWRRRVARAPDISRISVDELKALIAAGERPLVVDVRGQASQQFDPRRIPDAISVSLDAIQSGRHGLPRDRKIVLYCACPNEASAAKAARLLLDRGYVWVRPLIGGLDAWSATSANTGTTVSSEGEAEVQVSRPASV
ncbi:MAG TPA: DedA family protein/thiosulfate sulfurtransferase GlpE [Casimicrobiaceae bacterium]|nr:DedA family protein/thiosulfate sulfurtransferase GlpE [Casimicrobiaceae bacterium]